MLMIKNAEVYSPSYLGRKDILICDGRIEYIADEIKEMAIPCQVIDAKGQRVVPGLIDQHVHITGGGGEGSFHTRTPELQMSEMIEGGITTVVGLLGTDGLTRSVENLYAKTMALNEEGVTVYMLTGAYGNPGPTITGDAERDIVFIEKVLGLKLAISDHRAPNVTIDELIQAGSKTRVAGMLSGKPGMVVLHMGDAPEGLDPVFTALEETAIPVGIFRPTHVNRNPELMEQAYEFLEMGGYIDLTCGMTGDDTPTDCVLEAVKRELPVEHITISSDGHGSWSKYAEDGSLLEIGVSGVDSLLKELQHMVREKGMNLETALPYMTTNVAGALGLSGKKGTISEHADADILLFDENMELDTVIARGQVMMQEGKLLRRGTYEK